MKNNVVIIGGGLGGLFCGAILAKEGLHVTVLEKNATIGGGLQTFTRFGEVFDTGMHVVGGLQPGGNIWRICRYLGIEDKIRVRDVDADCADSLYFAEDHRYYTIAKGRDSFVNTLAKDFPHERENLLRYVDALYALTEELDLFYLRPAQTGIITHSADFMIAADDFIAKYIGDRKLRSVVAYMNPLYGGRGGQTPAYVHALISVLYINGASRFVGGSSRFANLLADVIRQHGGEMIAGDGVEWIECEMRNAEGRKKAVKYVRTRSGCQYEADWYISDIHPCTLLTLMDEHTFPKAFRDRMNEIPNSYSAFSLYIKMKDGRFPYINHSEYYTTRYDGIWNFCREASAWPMGFLLMTPPEENQGPWSTKVLVTAPMQFDMVRQWENTTVGKRGPEYEQWKQQRTDELLTMVEELHPGFCDAIEAVNASSPLTIRDFYGVKEGSCCGFSKDCNNLALTELPVVTKVCNLLLTGQNNNLHGFCGVPLTAITTCEVILGQNAVLSKL